MTSPVRARSDLLLCSFLFLAALTFFLTSALTRVKQPVAQDELWWLVAGETLYRTGAPVLYTNPGAVIAHSPHLYLRSIHFAFRLFGESETIARIPGILAGLLALLGVFISTRTFAPGSDIEKIKLASLTSLLYGTTPALIQGAAILDIDNTLLIPASLFLFFSFVRYQKENKARWAILTAIAMAIALWARVTAPTMIAFLLFFYVTMSRGHLKTKTVSVGMIVFGFFIFFVSWYFYCRVAAVPFATPFEYSLDALRGRLKSTGGLTSTHLLQNLICLVLWLGPFATILFLFSFLGRIRDFVRHRAWSPEDIYLLGSLFFLAGYTFVGGTPFGFPKYHSPGIALCYTYLGISTGKIGDLFSIRFRNLILLFVLAFLIQILTLSDSLYFFRYQLREALAFGIPSPDSLIRVGGERILFFIGFSGLFFMITKKFLRGKGILPALILFSLGSNVAMATLQNKAPYQTGYNYGARGTLETVRFIQEHVSPQSVVIAPSEIVYYLKMPHTHYLRDDFWKNPEAMRSRLIESETSALAVSIASNTIDQIRMIQRNVLIQKILRERFENVTIGSFRVWIRKENASPDV